MFVRVKPLPKISWSPKPLKPQCYSYGSIWAEPFLVKPHNLGTYDIWNGDKFKKSGNITYGYTPYNGRFLFNTTLLDNSKLQGGNNYTTKMYVKFTDTSGCSNMDSTTQTIYGTPLITLVPKTICQDIGSMMMDVLRTRPASKSGVYMRWDVVRAPSGIDTSKLLFNISGNSIPNIRFNFGAPSQDEYQGKYTFKLIVRDFVTGCQSTDTVDVSVIAEPTVTIKTIPDYCVNSGINVNMFDYITVNGVKPTGGTIYIQDVNGDRTNPKVTTNISSGVFKTSTGPGVYNIKYVSTQFGCTRIDSFNIIVHDTSDLRVRDTTICASSIPLDVLSLAVSNKGGTIVSYPDGRFFNGTTTPTGYVSGPYKWMMIGLTPYNCQDTEYAKITIVNIPKVKFVKPIEVCEFDTITLKIDTQYLNGGTFNWQPTTTFGPTMSRKYVPTSTDTALGYVDVRVDWAVAKNVCPNPFDTVRVYIHQYPDPTFTYQNGCEPLNTIFVPTERKGINPSLLTYDWYVSANRVSTNNGSVPYLFPTQGQYQVTLSITNVEGKKQCNGTITQTVNVYPKPSVVFNTDPLYKTTVALPKFKTVNTSSVSQTPFVTNMKHSWTWGKSYKIGGDTLKNSNIVFGKDTGTYWIKLVVTTDKGCKDSSMKKVVIGPDIIIFVPDAFTPDNAGPNENNTFRPYIINNKTYEMLIFNRWGEKMYETTDLTKGWDGNYKGQPAQDGVYVYKMIVTSLEDKVFQYNGTFTLIR
jgi:gliding motility-associated-like protein